MPSNSFWVKHCKTLKGKINVELIIFGNTQNNIQSASIMKDFPSKTCSIIISKYKMPNNSFNWMHDKDGLCLHKYLSIFDSSHFLL